MKRALPDIDKFERIVFKKKNALDRLLSFSLHLMRARQVGLLYGTDRSYRQFVPPERWDRGVMHKFNGRGVSGLLLKYFGTWIVRYKGLSPIRLYRNVHLGEPKESVGVIPYVLRKHKEFYEKGVKVLLIENIKEGLEPGHTHSHVPVLSYDGKTFDYLPDLSLTNAIAAQFRASNCLSAYVPDYGAIVFNNIHRDLLEKDDGWFVDEQGLRTRLDLLISAIEMASLSHLGRASGRQAVRVIWRKENRLRRTAQKLKVKKKELEAQKRYLKAVGAVNETQLNMEAVNITDGVYAFMDMVGSATIRKKFSPRDYFFILNLCHQIAADNAALYHCRVDNFIGDCVFLLNAAPFDPAKPVSGISAEERIMLMLLSVSATIREIDLLKKGRHGMDPDGRVKKLINTAGTDIGFRAGMEIGASMIGPIGSQKRRIVTAIGKAVNNASRLESTGMKEWIHVSEDIISRLSDAFITKDTRLLRRVVSKEGGAGGEQRLPLRFLDYYQEWIGVTETVIKEKKNISYKEYEKDLSYLIQSLSKPSSFPD